MKKFFQNIKLPTSTSGGANSSSPADCSTLYGPSSIFLIFLGTFNAAYKPEVSVDGLSWVDGTKFFFDLSTGVQLAADVSATGTQLYTKQNIPFVRFRCTTFVSSGTTDPPRVYMTGQDSRSQ